MHYFVKKDHDEYTLNNKKDETIVLTKYEKTLLLFSSQVHLQKDCERLVIVDKHIIGDDTRYLCQQ